MTFTIQTFVGETTIEFDPADADFSQRFSKTVEEAEKVTRRYHTGLMRLKPAKAFERRRKGTQEINQLIDTCLGPVSEQLLGSYALAEDVYSHKPCWAVVMRDIACHITAPLSDECKSILGMRDKQC